jgi:hypothetical protein
MVQLPAQAHPADRGIAFIPHTVLNEKEGRVAIGRAALSLAAAGNRFRCFPRT